MGKCPLFFGYLFIFLGEKKGITSRRFGFDFDYDYDYFFKKNHFPPNK